MHIEPGVVEGAKIALSVVTAAGAIGYAAKLALSTVKQALALSTAYQGGVIAWVAFLAFYGNGFGADNLIQVGSSVLHI